MFTRFFKRKQDQAPATPCPAEPLFMIGDCHGEIAALDRLLAQRPRGARLVILGDMIDRGAASADVLRRIFDLVRREPQAIVIMGNHERMMLDFLRHPRKSGAQWLNAGGMTTLKSFGLDESARQGAAHPLENMAAALREVMPAGMEDWLGGLPLYWQSGNIVAVHAALDPKKPLAKQREKTLLWANPAAMMPAPRADGLIPVHGHVPVDAPAFAHGRIALDTGAGKGGDLSALVLRNDGMEFMTNTIKTGK